MRTILPVPVASECSRSPALERIPCSGTAPGSSLVPVAPAGGHCVADLSRASVELGEGRQQGWHRRLSPSGLAAPWWDVPVGGP